MFSEFLEIADADYRSSLAIRGTELHLTDMYLTDEAL